MSVICPTACLSRGHEPHFRLSLALFVPGRIYFQNTLFICPSPFDAELLLNQQRYF